MGVQLTSISATFFTNLLSRLGVKPPPTDGFDLINTVQPVSIVDQDVALSTVGSTVLLDTPFTAGLQTAPGAAAILADCGQQAQGTYQVYCEIGIGSEAALATALELSRRNGANNGDIWVIRFIIANGVGANPAYQFQARIQLQVNERLVFRTVGAFPAAQTVLANIWLTAG